MENVFHCCHVFIILSIFYFNKQVTLHSQFIHYDPLKCCRTSFLRLVSTTLQDVKIVVYQHQVPCGHQCWLFMISFHEFMIILKKMLMRCLMMTLIRRAAVVLLQSGTNILIRKYSWISLNRAHSTTLFKHKPSTQMSRFRKHILTFLEHSTCALTYVD